MMLATVMHHSNKGIKIFNDITCNNMVQYNMIM